MEEISKRFKTNSNFRELSFWSLHFDLQELRLLININIVSTKQTSNYAQVRDKADAKSIDSCMLMRDDC
jgi:hypothetical protein